VGAVRQGSCGFVVSCAVPLVSVLGGQTWRRASAVLEAGEELFEVVWVFRHVQGWHSCHIGEYSNDPVIDGDGGRRALVCQVDESVRMVDEAIDVRPLIREIAHRVRCGKNGNDHAVLADRNDASAGHFAQNSRDPADQPVNRARTVVWSEVPHMGYGAASRPAPTGLLRVSEVS